MTFIVLRVFHFLLNFTFQLNDVLAVKRAAAIFSRQLEESGGQLVEGGLRGRRRRRRSGLGQSESGSEGEAGSGQGQDPRVEGLARVKVGGR